VVDGSIKSPYPQSVSTSLHKRSYLFWERRVVFRPERVVQSHSCPVWHSTSENIRFTDSSIAGVPTAIGQPVLRIIRCAVRKLADPVLRMDHAFEEVAQPEIFPHALA